ncbi:MAG: hypothetical protein E7202_11070 [Selenomonas ruminantium]|nr:hypothetical protein [Selenomonas ruminantium]
MCYNCGVCPRFQYFFYVGKTIVMTNGFVKKTQKTLKAQIELPI